MSAVPVLLLHLVLWRAHGPLVGVLDALALAHFLDHLTRRTA